MSCFGVGVQADTLSVLLFWVSGFASSHVVTVDLMVATTG